MKERGREREKGITREKRMKVDWYREKQNKTQRKKYLCENNTSNQIIRFLT